MSQIYDQHLEPFGLTVTQYGVLGHLATFGDDAQLIGAVSPRLTSSHMQIHHLGTILLQRSGGQFTQLHVKVADRGYQLIAGV